MYKRQNKYVAVTYDLNVGEGEERELMEKATVEAPLKFIYGTGMMLPAFEKALNGLEVGGTFNFSIEPAEAYGEYNEEHVLDLPKNIFEVDGKFDAEMIKEGNTVPMMDSNGNRMNGSVLEVKDDIVVMDFNHPLAGETLHFSGEVIDVHEPTAEEIAACDGIIVAADKEVRMARFDGKPVIVTKVADGIHKPQELIEDIINGRAKVYHNDGKGEENAGIGDESLGRKLYKALMNGVSHMLPFVIGGGILIALSFICDGANAGTDVFGNGTALAKFFNTVGNTAFGMMFPILAGYIAMAIGERPALMPGIVGGLLAKAGTSIFLPEDQWVSSGFFGALIAGFVAGYLMVLIKKLLEKLPHALEGTKPVLLYPFLGIVAMGAIMIFIVNPPMGAFNTWLNNVLTNMGEGSKITLGAVLGGMMAIDFGGPFNKAAYVFGTASIASGQFDMMAAVMAGGMVPPLAIALATTFFKNRFTKSEQQTTVTNYIMGLSFITEGAIPFAASDPLRIIPPCVVGSAIAGALSMAFGCGSRAPHGGIFVIGIIDHGPMFLLAILIGAVVGMAGIVLLKKPLKAD